MLKTIIVNQTFSGGATYDEVIPTDIKLYAQVQIKAPSTGLKYRVNGTPHRVNGTPPSPDYVPVSEDEYLQHPYDRATPQEPCADSITVLATGTIPVEIQYYT